MVRDSTVKQQKKLYAKPLRTWPYSI